MKYLIFLISIGFSSLSRAQQDSVKNVQPHPYKKSMLFSAIIPGAGQVRNSVLSEKKIKNAFWKLPIIYGSLGTSLYLVFENQRIQNSIKDEYYSREAGNDPSLDWINYDSYGLIALQQSYLNSRDLFILLTVAIHGLQILDAGVEAHFLNFEVNEDLSITLKPKIQKNNILISANFVLK